MAGIGDFLKRMPVPQRPNALDASGTAVVIDTVVRQAIAKERVSVHKNDR
jgi:hypothetical protein